MSNELMTVNNFITTTKTDIAEFVSAAIARVLNGEMEASRLARFAKALEEMAKQIMGNDQMKSALHDELSLYEGGKADLHNATFQIKAVGVKYDYSQCGDPEWDELKEEVDIASNKLKAREEYLKKLSRQTDVKFIDKNGEIHEATIYPPAKSGSEQVVITIKK